MNCIKRTVDICLLAVFIVSTFLLSTDRSLFAQVSKQKQLTLMLIESKVRPSNSVKYEAALKEVLSVVRSRNINTVNFFTLKRDDFTYYYVAQVDDPAHPDPQSKFWADLQAELGDEAAARLRSGFDGLVESSKASYVHRRFDLSYGAEDAASSSEPMPLTHTDWYYFDPGSFDEAVALAKEFKALWKKNKVERSYRLYFGGVGTERPMFLVAQNAKSESDYYSYVDQRNAAIGEEPLNRLVNRLWAITKKFEHVNSRLRPDLSNGEPAKILTAK
jgi:hypothetical protein